MVIALADDEWAELLAEAHRERFGDSVPWRETRTTPSPTPPPASRRPVVRTIEDPRVCARRLRDLCLAIDGYFIDDRPPADHVGARAA